MTRMRYLGAAVALALLVVAPFTQATYGTYVLTSWLVFSIAAMGLNMTLGYAGQISLAQATFMGIGAYSTALLTVAGYPWICRSASRSSSASAWASCSGIRPCVCSTTCLPL